MTISVGIYLFDDMEVLDFAGPFEVFTTASRVFLRGAPADEPPFEVFTIAKTSSPVRARAGLRTVPEFLIDACPDIQWLLVPGGIVDREMEDESVIDWIRATASNASLTASVCTGAFLLAKAGLLDWKAATTHWEDVQDLKNRFPDVNVKESVRWVDEGTIVSSAGIAAGIDMSLHLVARFHGQELAKATARQMDVPYRAEA